MPLCKLDVYPVSGHAGHSKGLKMKVLGGIEGASVVRQGYCPLVAFSWGNAPPLGVTPYMLADGKTWTMTLSGYFHPQIPEGYTGGTKYTFGYVATGLVAFDLQGMTNQFGSSPHRISELGTIGTNADWIKLEVAYMRSDAARENRRLRDERFVLFWKDDIDNEWRIMGADVTIPPEGDFTNLEGLPVLEVPEMEFSTAWAPPATHILEVHKVGDSYHFHKDREDTEFPLTPGQTIRHNLNPGVAGGYFITIKWNDTINDGDMVQITTARGFEKPWTFKPSSVEHTALNEAASVLRFSVPVTSDAFDPGNVTRDNQFTYYVPHNSYGVLRPNRLIEFSTGYMVNGQAEYVRRFTGFIDSIHPRHAKNAETGEKMLNVTCIDTRVQTVGQPVNKIEDLGISPLPNSLSYDLAGFFTTDIDPPGPNGAVRPPAFDSWNLAKVVRTVLTQNGYLSSQLWAKDENGNLLIEDRGVYLERTPAYPHAVVSSTGARAEVQTEGTQTKYDWNLGFQFLRGYTQPKQRWMAYAETQELPYLYQFGIDDDPWNELRELCQSYGLQFGQNADGDVYLRYPDNPIIRNTHEADADGGTKSLYTSSTLTDSSKNWAHNHWRQGRVMITNGPGAGQVRRVSGNTSTKLNIYPDWETQPNNKSWYVVVKDEAFLSNNITYDNSWEQYPEPGQSSTDADDFWALRCMYHKGDGVASVVFAGVGVKMIFPRPESTSIVRIEIDGHVVNGENVLDSETGDKGHTDWLDRVLDNSGKVSLALEDLPSSVDPWYYRHGIHPEIGKTPALFTICDDLTYGTHVAVITVMAGDVYIEGFGTITSSREKSQHDFDAYHDLSELSASESMAGHINDVVVVGNMKGAAGDYITSRATDINAISDADSNNFVGARKPLILSHPNIVNQDRADYLARHALRRYRRGERKPVVSSAGLPWLEPDDVITIKDGAIGYFAPWQLTPAQRLATGKSHVAYGTYWIESLTERIDTQGGAPSYTMEVSATNRPPLPAFEPTPEPVEADFYHAIDAFKMTIDGEESTYNPFLEEAEGKYVNVVFGLTWHARSLIIRVVVGEHIDKVFDDGTELHLEPGSVIQTLMSQTGFVPAGKYEATWDGWMVVDESSGSGFYAPDGTYYIELRTERYSTGEAFVYRSDSDMPNIMQSGSLEHIVIEQDRGDVYGSDPFDVDISPSGTFQNPAIVYDWETNDGKGIEFEVKLDCPARLSIYINMKLMTLFGSTTPSSLEEGYFPYDKARMEFRPDSTEILDPGTYLFYFKPALHTKMGIIPRSFWELPENITEADAQKSWWVCWYYSLYNAFCFEDLSGNREFINPTTIAFIWGGRYDGQYNAVQVDDTKGYYTFFKIKS